MPKKGHKIHSRDRKELAKKGGEASDTLLGASCPLLTRGRRRRKEKGGRADKGPLPGSGRRETQGGSLADIHAGNIGLLA